MQIADQLIIRDATQADVPVMATLITHLGYPTTVEEMQQRFDRVAVHPDYRTLLATMDNEVVGLAGLAKGLYYEKNDLYIRVVAFVVKEGMRGAGIGKKLIAASEDWALQQGATVVLINSGLREERKPAYAFYQKMGYEIKSSGFVKQL